MNSTWYYNPFIYIAGTRALLFGILGLLLLSVVSFYSGTHFYGHFGTSFAKDSPYWIYLLEHISHWIILSILMFVAAKLFLASQVRIIDVFGTILLAQLPLILSPLLRMLPPFQSFVFNSSQMYGIYGLFLVSTFWSILLKFNAFKVSTNLKEGRLFISFTLSIVLAEIATRILLHQIN